MWLLKVLNLDIYLDKMSKLLMLTRILLMNLDIDID
jgi:hypothetical protein